MEPDKFGAVSSRAIGGSGGNSPTVTGAVKVLNGPPSTGVTAKAQRAASPHALVGTEVPDGTYRLSPSRMTFAITGVALVPAGGTANHPLKIYAMSGCTATYDRSQGSLAVMSNCAVDVPTGSFGGIILQYDPTYTVVMDDAEASIYSDPSAPGGLTCRWPKSDRETARLTDRSSARAAVAVRRAAHIRARC